jgi:hypothetical protein
MNVPRPITFLTGTREAGDSLPRLRGAPIYVGKISFARAILTFLALTNATGLENLRDPRE